MGPPGRRYVIPLMVGLLAAACSRSQTDASPAPSRSPAETPSASPSTDEGPSQSGFDPANVRLELRPVTAGLEAPLLVTHAGDGSGRLFIVEQVGRIRIFEDGRLKPAPFLDISGLITAGGEQGLLGLAFHPDYDRNGRFFVNYTDLQGDTIVAEYGRSVTSAARADASSARVLLRIDQPFANHNGGNLVFGRDHYLYIGMGDGGSAGDPLGNGQRLDTLLGKLLRIDVDSPEGPNRYGIPPDNPFAQSRSAMREIWAYGLRNPWRFSFDRETDDLWIGDVGQGSLEEIDVEPAGSGGGLNYGWNVMEGKLCFEPAVGCDRGGLVMPVAVYSHDLGCSVTGGFVYRGSESPVLVGGYLFADYCSGTIWGIDAAGAGRRDPVVLVETGRSISSFGEDEAGELYVTDLASGEVFQVVARPA